MNSIDMSDLIMQVLLALGGIMVVLVAVMALLGHRSGGTDAGHANDVAQVRVTGAASTVTTGLKTVTRVSGGSSPSNRR
jgi:hypothetical protein